MREPIGADITGDMKLVVDTDVLTSAMRSSTGASAELLRFAYLGRFDPVISVPLAIEYEAVLFRPVHLEAAGLSTADADHFLNGFIRLATRTRVHFRYRPVTKDPADELIVEAALNGGAEALVTFNRRDFGTGPSQFGIGCWYPAEALERLR